MSTHSADPVDANQDEHKTLQVDRSSPRPSWLLLALWSVVPLILVCAITELVARKFYTESSSESPCFILNDPSTGVRGIPNSVCRRKELESDWVEYRYNSCGHRAGMECAVKPNGTYRIVLMGSSLSEGYMVSQPQSFAGLLPELLSKDSGRTVELYNEGMEWGSPLSMSLRFDQVLAERPQLILWPVTPWDISHVTLDTPLMDPASKQKNTNFLTKDGNPDPGAPKPGRMRLLWSALTQKRDWSSSLRDRSRAFFMLQHLLYKSDSIYLAHATSPDEYTPSMQDEPDKEWERKLQQYDSYLSAIIEKAKIAGVPVVVMVLPRHAQAVLIASGKWPQGMNPYSFGDQIKRIVTKDNGIYIDILGDFRNMADVGAAFYPIDQHLTVAGNRMFAEIMAKELTHGAVPALNPNKPSEPSMEATK